MADWMDDWTPPDDRPEDYRCLGWIGEWAVVAWVTITRNSVPCTIWMTADNWEVHPTHWHPLPAPPAGVR